MVDIRNRQERRQIIGHNGFPGIGGVVGNGELTVSFRPHGNGIGAGSVGEELQIHRIKAVRLQKDAVHDAEHGAVAAAGAAHLVDDGPVIAFFPEGMCRIVHDNTRLSVLSV